MKIRGSERIENNKNIKGRSGPFIDICPLSNKKSTMKTAKKLKLTTRGRYAMTALIDLAQRDGKTPVPLAEIARTGDISLSYLEQLFAGLRKNGLVKSYRGPGGGYVLARRASDIRVSDILHSAEDCALARRNGKDDFWSEADDGLAGALWGHIGEILHAQLHHISLEDVLSGRIKDLSVQCCE